MTAATSFQTCVDEEEEDPAVSTSTVESEPPAAILEEPPPRRRGVVHVKSHLSAGLRPPRHDNRHLRPPPAGSRDRRSASMGAVRPSTIFQSPYNNCNADFGELLTSIKLLSSIELYFSVLYISCAKTYARLKLYVAGSHNVQMSVSVLFCRVSVLFCRKLEGQLGGEITCRHCGQKLKVEL